MRLKPFFFLWALCVCSLSKGQYYYPPTSGSAWDTVSPASLGWCTSQLDTLYNYLDARHSKSFIVLHKGRIALEKYFNGHGQDSAWYWASAGKSLTSFLVGIAGQEGLLDINNKTSQYLGSGWTSAPAVKEDLITLQSQLTMTTGLDYSLPDQNCLEDTCLKYKNDVGTHWYYHNAPYRLLQDVVESASGKGFNLYTFQKLNASTGISGLWLNYVFFSNARKMARFGLLNLSRGQWNGAAVLTDTAYFNAMVKPSQNLNPAYGYLWWLNGQSFYKQPGTDSVFNGPIISTAPTDLYMAAGANDQRIYVVPSLDLVVVRQGNEAYTSQLALSQFDPELWSLLMNVICNPVSTREPGIDRPSLFPNPGEDFINLTGEWGSLLQIYDQQGRSLPIRRDNGRLDISRLSPGTYLLMDMESGRGQRFGVY